MPVSPDVECPASAMGPARPAQIDADLLAAMTLPALQGSYPRDSKAFVRIDTSLRIYWHTLFDSCPKLLDLAQPDGLAIFRPFMTWANDQGLSLNWAYYLWAGVWLLQSPYADQVSHDLLQDLMDAAAARWAIGNRSEDSGIILGCSRFADLTCGWKCRSMTSGRVIERIELDAALPPPSGLFGFFTQAGEALVDTFPGWQAIPR